MDVGALSCPFVACAPQNFHRTVMSGEEDDLMTPEEALIDCARYGELDEVTEILNTIDPVVDVNAADPSGNTALHNGA